MRSRWGWAAVRRAARAGAVLVLAGVFSIIGALAVVAPAAASAAAPAFSPDLTDVSALLNTSGLEQAAGQVKNVLGTLSSGTMPLLAQAPEMVQGQAGSLSSDAQGAAAQLGVLTQTLHGLSAPANAVLSGAKGLPLPGGTLEVMTPAGQAWVLQQGGYAELCIHVAGPGLSQAIVGIGDTSPLCGSQTPPMQNSAHAPRAVIDMTPDNHSYLDIQLPLAGSNPLPQISGEDYIPLGNGQHVAVGLTTNAGAWVKLRFTVGFKEEVNDVVTAGMDQLGVLTVQVKPDAVPTVLQDVGAALARYSSLTSPAAPLTANQAGTLLTAVLHGLGGAANVVGDLSLGVDAAADLGVGVPGTTTKITAMGATGTFDLSIPAAQIPNIALTAVQGLMTAGGRMAAGTTALESAALTGLYGTTDATLKQNLDNVQQMLGNEWQGAASPALQQVAGGLAGGRVALGLSVDLLGKPATGSVTLWKAEASVPLDQAVTEPKTFVQQTIHATASLFVPWMRQANVTLPPAAVSDLMKYAQRTVPSGTEFSLQVAAPGFALLSAFVDVPAQALLTAAASSGTDFADLMDGIVNAFQSGSLSKLQTSDLIKAWTSADWSPLRNDTTFGLNLGGGGTVNVGEGVTGNFGAYGAVTASTNVQLPLYLASGGSLAEPSTPGHASLGMALQVSAAGTVGTEDGFTGSAGAIASTSWVQLTVDEFDAQPLPDYINYVEADGFRVFDLQNAVFTDGKPTGGTGQLALPTGGFVTVHFGPLDASGHATGTWQGAFRFGSHAFNVPAGGGTLDGAGLHWSAGYDVWSGQYVKLALTMDSGGTLSAGSFAYSGAVLGATLNATLTMPEAGVFNGTGTLSYGPFHLSGVALNINADTDTITGSGTLPVGNRNGLLNSTFTLDHNGFKLNGSAYYKSSWQDYKLIKLQIRGNLSWSADAATPDPSTQVGLSLYGQGCVEYWAVGWQKVCSPDATYTGTLDPTTGELSIRVHFPHNVGGYTYDKYIKALYGLLVPQPASAAVQAYNTQTAQGESVSSVSLADGPLTLHPAFDPGITGYTATCDPALDGPCKSVTISWAPPAGVSGQEFAVLRNGSPVTPAGDSAVVPLAAGANLITLLVDSPTGTHERGYFLLVDRLVVDNTPPVTTEAASVPPNASGWYSTDLPTVTLRATDPQGSNGAPPSGVAAIRYNLDAAGWRDYVAPLVIGTQGIHTLQYRAIDAAGNAEAARQATIRVDSTPPATTASVDHRPNRAGWNDTAVDVTLEATDNLSGVAGTQYNLDHTGWTTYTAAVPIASEGVHQFQYRSTDVAGNVEAAQSLTVRVDRTPPVTRLAASPGPNANGWNRQSVTLTLHATDNLSGVASTLYNLDGAGWSAYTAPVTISGQGIHRFRYRSTDAAGNVEATHTRTVRIDTTPPVTTASPAPQANPGGWNNTAVAVSLSAADNLSGVASTQYDLNGAGWSPYTAPVQIAGEGKNVLQYRSADLAGNVEAAHRLLVRVDVTPPEARLTFDRATGDILVTGTDQGSGVPPGGIQLISTRPVQWGSIVGGSVPPAANAGPATLRTYRITDRAGNQLTLKLAVRAGADQLQAVVTGLAYTNYEGTTSKPVPSNEMRFSWSASESHVQQEITVGSKSRAQDLRAGYAADQTTVKPEHGKTLTLPGFVSLQLSTSKGSLNLGY